MPKNPLTNLVQDAITCAMNAVLRKGQTYINTAALFDGVQRTFARKTSDCAKLSADIKAILGKYGINSQNFNEAYADLFPVGEELPKTVDVELEDDALNVIDTLTLKAQTEERLQDLDDFLAQLFSNKSYKLFMTFSRVSDKMKEKYDAAVEAGTSTEDLPPVGFDVNIFYDDMQKLLVKTTVKAIKSLETEEMQKYLTNINKYVADHSDLKIIGMEDTLTAIMVGLAGRTKKSVIIKGKPGTGKTAMVQELARRINSNNVPDLLKGTVIYELHMDALVAGR